MDTGSSESVQEVQGTEQGEKQGCKGCSHEASASLFLGLLWLSHLANWGRGIGPCILQVDYT